MYELNKKVNELSLQQIFQISFLLSFLKGFLYPKYFWRLNIMFIYIYLSYIYMSIYIFSVLFCFFFFPPHSCRIFRSTPHTFNLFAYIYCFYCTRHDTFYYAKNRYYILTSKIHISFQEEEKWQQQQ